VQLASNAPIFSACRAIDANRVVFCAGSSLYVVQVGCGSIDDEIALGHYVTLATPYVFRIGSSSNNLVCVASIDGTLMVVDVVTRQRVQYASGTQGIFATPIVVSPMHNNDGGAAEIVVGSRDNAVHYLTVFFMD
jgi:hypothetical protein